MARYIGRRGTKRIAKVVLIGSVTPLVLKRESCRTLIEVLDGFRKAVIANRSQFFKDLAIIYFGANRPGANISENLLNSCWYQDMLTGFPAAYFAIKAFSETNMTEDLKTIDCRSWSCTGMTTRSFPLAMLIARPS